MTKQQNNRLDCIRAICALLFSVFHSTQQSFPVLFTLLDKVCGRPDTERKNCERNQEISGGRCVPWGVYSENGLITFGIWYTFVNIPCLCREPVEWARTETGSDRTDAQLYPHATGPSHKLVCVLYLIHFNNQPTFPRLASICVCYFNK